MTIIGAASSAAHILILPYPAQGHMIPLLDLTRNLAARNLTITIVVTPKNLHLLKSLLSDHPSIQTLVLPFPSHPSLPSGVENAKDLPPNSFVAMICALGQLHDPLLHWFQNHPSPPVAIISDMFSGWTHRLARRLSVRNITFSPSGAMALSTIYSLWRDLPTRRNQPDDVYTFSRVPNYPKYPWWQISPVYRSYVEGDPDSEFLKDGFQGHIASWGLVVNSFSELERVYLDHLVKELGHDRVWAVGPLLPPPNHDNIFVPADRGGPSSVSVAEIFSWLDACQDLKVVYVCFGSQVILTNVQMKGIAQALEKSGVHFIWSVKNPTKEQHMDESYGSIPSGFEDRVAGRGLVIKGWAPQVHILSHRAVGSFLTHCGWNSILEGTMAGVTMLAWPMGADQFVNASLIVDDLKVAKRVCEGAHTVPNSTELARVLAESVAGNRVEKERVMELSRAAAKAVKDGSSVKDLDALVKSIIGLEL